MMWMTYVYKTCYGIMRKDLSAIELWTQEKLDVDWLGECWWLDQLGGVGVAVVGHCVCGGEQDSTVTNPLPDRPTHLFRALPVVSASFFFGHL